MAVDFQSYVEPRQTRENLGDYWHDQIVKEVPKYDTTLIGKILGMWTDDLEGTVKNIKKFGVAQCYYQSVKELIQDNPDYKQLLEDIVEAQNEGDDDILVTSINLDTPIGKNNDITYPSRHNALAKYHFTKNTENTDLELLEPKDMIVHNNIKMLTNKHATTTAEKPIYAYPPDTCDNTFHSWVQQPINTGDPVLAKMWPWYFKFDPKLNTSNAHESLAAIRKSCEFRSVDHNAQFNEITRMYMRPLADIGGSVRLVSNGLDCFSSAPPKCLADIVREAERAKMRQCLIDARSRGKVSKKDFYQFYNTMNKNKHYLFNFTDVLYYIQRSELIDFFNTLPEHYVDNTVATFTMHVPLYTKGDVKVGSTTYGSYVFNNNNLTMNVVGNHLPYDHPHHYTFLADNEVYLYNADCDCNNCPECRLTAKNRYVHFHVKERYPLGDIEYISGTITLSQFPSPNVPHHSIESMYCDKQDDNPIQQLGNIMDFANTEMTTSEEYKIVTINNERKLLLVKIDGYLSGVYIKNNFAFTYESFKYMKISAVKYSFMLPIKILNEVQRLIIEAKGQITPKWCNDVIHLITLRQPNIDASETAIAIIREALKRTFITQMRIMNLMNTRGVKMLNDICTGDMHEMTKWDKVICSLGSLVTGNNELSPDDLLEKPTYFLSSLFEIPDTKPLKEAPKIPIIRDRVAFVKNADRKDDLCARMRKIRVTKQCEVEGMDKDLSESFALNPLHKIVRGKYKEKFGSFKIQYAGCTCNNRHGRDTVGALRILSVKENSQPIIMYSNCNKTLLAATYRQLSIRAAADPAIMKTFHRYCDKIFAAEILPLLSQLKDNKYSYKAWYLHLTTKQKQEIDKLLLDIQNNPSDKRLFTPRWSMFCKCEKQIRDDPSKPPKNRCICCPNAVVKFVMGPIVWALEKLFKDNFFGYECDGAKNWEEMEQRISAYSRIGLKIILQTDVSGYDNSQTVAHKYIDNLIYNKIADLGIPYHTGILPNDIFRTISTAETRELVVTSTEKNNREELLVVNVIGSVFSGNPDTTFGNTLRQALYQRFIYEEQMGLDKSQYRLWCKGDDCIVFLNATNGCEAYYELFYSTKNNLDPKTHLPVPHGLGMYLKRITIGGYETYDFCSTHLLFDQFTSRCRIVRQLDRTSVLNCYSESLVKAHNCYHAKVLLTNMAEEMACWAKDIPVFKEYIRAYTDAANAITYTEKEEKDYTKLENKKMKAFYEPSPIEFMDDPLYRKDISVEYVEDQREQIINAERQSRNYVDPKTLHRLVKNKYQLSDTAIAQYYREIVSTDFYGTLQSELSIRGQLLED
jgi:hypothetical protein